MRVALICLAISHLCLVWLVAVLWRSQRRVDAVLGALSEWVKTQDKINQVTIKALSR